MKSTLREKIEIINFEEFDGNIPAGFQRTAGAMLDKPLKRSECLKDNEIFYEGNTSLYLSGDTDTSKWYFLRKNIPTNIEKLKVEYYVSGEFWIDKMKITYVYK